MVCIKAAFTWLARLEQVYILSLSHHGPGTMHGYHSNCTSVLSHIMYHGTYLSLISSLTNVSMGSRNIYSH